MRDSARSDSMESESNQASCDMQPASRRRANDSARPHQISMNKKRPEPSFFGWKMEVRREGRGGLIKSKKEREREREIDGNGVFLQVTTSASTDLF